MFNIGREIHNFKSRPATPSISLTLISLAHCDLSQNIPYVQVTMRGYWSEFAANPPHHFDPTDPSPPPIGDPQVRRSTSRCTTAPCATSASSRICRTSRACSSVAAPATARSTSPTASPAHRSRRSAGTAVSGGRCAVLTGHSGVLRDSRGYSGALGYSRGTGVLTGHSGVLTGHSGVLTGHSRDTLWSTRSYLGVAGYSEVCDGRLPRRDIWMVRKPNLLSTLWNTRDIYVCDRRKMSLRTLDTLFGPGFRSVQL